MNIIFNDTIDQNLLDICVRPPNVCPRDSAKKFNNIIVFNTLNNHE